MPKNQRILIPLAKAVASLKSALNQPKNEFTRDAVIQRFEYTYELSWKMLKRYLFEEAGVKEFNIKNIYREGGRQNLIENVERWFEYHTARNLTSYTYNENIAEETYDVVRRFLDDAESLLSNLDKLWTNAPKKERD